MRIAIPVRQGRVSPVFDAARHLWIVDVENGCQAGRSRTILSQRDPLDRAKHVCRCGVELLICGAISRPLMMTLTAVGIEVVPFICGSIEEVIAAFSEGRLAEERFQMPGAKGSGRAAASSGKAPSAPAKARQRAPKRHGRALQHQ
jgi:predicted Fe-Mo cluster-binding NifX family protein